MKSNLVWQQVQNCIRAGSYEINYDELGVPCPNCGDESHFSVNIFSGAYNCYKCPLGGSIWSHIMHNMLEWKRITKSQPTVVRKTKREVLPDGFHLLSALRVGEQTENPREAKGNPFLTLEKLAVKAERYCRARGITPEQIERYRIALRKGENRVFFPYWNTKGDIIFYVGRALSNNTTPKTVEPINSVKPLYGRHVQKVGPIVLLVEGVFDHLVTPDSYSIMGSNITEEQIQQLVEDGIKKVGILMDADADVKSGACQKKLARRRVLSFPIKLVSLKGTDPSQIGVAKMQEVSRTVMKELERSNRSRIITI